MTLEVEKATAEKAVMSGQKQQDPARKVRQKDGMAQKSGMTSKSNVVYASEDYFNDLRDRIERNKAKDAARVNWRGDIQEAQKEKPQDEGDHPYVDVMPHTQKMPNAGNGKAKAKAGAQGLDTSLGEGSKFLKNFKAPKIPGNRRDKDREQYLKDLSPERPPKGGKNFMKDEFSFDDVFGRFVDESSLNPFQVHFDKDGKEYKDKGTENQAKRIAKNIADNRKKGPMKQDPYKPRRGESD